MTAEEWVDRQLRRRPVLTENEIVRAIKPVVARVIANTGQYAGDYPADAARRILRAIRNVERGEPPE